MKPAHSVTIPLNLETHSHGRKVLQQVDEGKKPLPKGRLPRITRLLSLAIYFEELLAGGVVNDYADIARLGYVSRARLTQIMNLRLLAPDIQEEILNLSLITSGRDPIPEHALRPITLEPSWKWQRKMWHALKKEHDA